MKKHVLEFMRRGVVALGFGPLVLAVLYLILRHQGLVEILTVNDVCMGILSVSALAFVAGGMNFIYQIERLPLMVAILIHGCILYCSYLITYLLNDWLEWGVMPIMAFTVIFVVGYLVIWAIIYTTIKKKTDMVNEGLKKKQRNTEEP